MIVDANQVTIFEQDIKDVKQTCFSKSDLTDLMAKKMASDRVVNRYNQDIKKYENLIKKSLSEDNEEIALEIAKKISSIEADLEIEQSLNAKLKQYISKLQDLISDLGSKLSQMKKQLVIYKATASAHEFMIVGSNDYDKLVGMKSSISDIVSKQQEIEDKFSLKQSMHDKDDLDEKLKKAGIVDKPDC